jgi:putative endonuclease
MSYYVYILANKAGTVLYTGVTNNLVRRTWEHREKLVASFASRYNATRLVYYEAGHGAEGAIAREKQIKAGSRARKLRLIHSMNPEWRDLWDEIASG